MTNFTLAVYIIYLTFIFVSTFFVAKTIFKNSTHFMLSIFNNREGLARATNKLFETGFFLMAFGVGLFYTEHYSTIKDYQDFFNVLSLKAGFFTIFLGVMLFFNLFLFFRGMKYRSMKKRENEGHTETNPQS
jgi:hypothetical protein